MVYEYSYTALEGVELQLQSPHVARWAGIPQGTLIRRHRFPGPSGERLKPEELTVGMDLNVYGKNIRVVHLASQKYVKMTSKIQLHF